MVVGFCLPTSQRQKENKMYLSVLCDSAVNHALKYSGLPYPPETRTP